MEYLTFPLGRLSRGSVVVVALSGDESDVFIVDQPNLHAFERGTSFHYHGVHAKQSPVQIAVPAPGDWTAVVVPTGSSGVRATVRVLSST